MEAATNRKYSVVRKILVVSLLVNIFFAIKFAVDSVNRPEGKYGILKHDVKVGLCAEGDREIINITLPKCIAVRNSSPRAFNHIGLFEPNWFQITITSDEENLVDYSLDRKKWFRHHFI